MLSYIPSSVYWSPYTHSTTAHQHPHIDLPVANIMTHILIHTHDLLHRYQFPSFVPASVTVIYSVVNTCRPLPPPVCHFALKQYFRYSSNTPPYSYAQSTHMHHLFYFMFGEENSSSYDRIEFHELEFFWRLCNITSCSVEKSCPSTTQELSGVDKNTKCEDG